MWNVRKKLWSAARGEGVRVQDKAPHGWWLHSALPIKDIPQHRGFRTISRFITSTISTKGVPTISKLEKLWIKFQKSIKWKSDHKRGIATNTGSRITNKKERRRKTPILLFKFYYLKRFQARHFFTTNWNRDPVEIFSKIKIALPVLKT